eukprot:CAMPEP_0173291744 /NCGR_PEP_ID=MMETSP1143-20121109/12329_1 /TAXON_ID=483371 /ORGANISM="non described non described, Strain CCMP2298" /LENGTH=231 /DNA_ID=CAMNT_0014231027 /DNA_START=62 /DNA_END=753 /DNA_ORIENTATION=+
MTQPPENHWALLLGNPETFGLTVGPFLSNRELFQLSAASRALLNLRYALGRWAVQLDRSSYNAFRTKLHSVPVCFAGQDFDLVTHLGNRLKVVVRDPPGGRRIVDVSALAGVHSLDLSGCEYIIDVNALGGVHSLNLTGCYRIKDVSALRAVHTLTLTKCHYLWDVSALAGVHTLKLNGCWSLTDVSALGGVHTLDLSRNATITDVSALGSVHTLDLTGCTGIRDASALGG